MKSFISRDDSKSLYGIAILLMVFHHCFLDPARLNNAYISVWGDLGWLETRLAWSGKLCVAIYAFISGYGLSKWAKQKKNVSFARDYMKSLRQLFRFYRQFWLVFIIFVPIGVIFFERECSSTLILRGMFLGEYYSGEWWYVKQYLVFMILFPILDCLISWIEKRHLKQAVFAGSICIIGIVILSLKFWDSIVATAFIWCINTLAGSYTYIFIVAYVIARYDVYEKASKHLKWKPWIYVLGIGLVFVVRFFYVTNPAQRNCDVILTPFLIFFMVQVLHIRPVEHLIVPVLRFWGEYSTFIWLTHTFYIYTYFQWIGLLPRYSVLIYFWVLFVALMNSIVLKWVYQKMGRVGKKLLMRVTMKTILTMPLI